MEHLLARLTSRDDIPEGYQPPPFPSLHWPPQDIQDMQWNLYRISDIWRFTLLWTVFIYAGFHLGAAGIALLMQVGKGKERWKYIWTVPFLYAFAAGIEALCAGSVVGAIVGASYQAGRFTMSTWIPFIWGWVNVLVLIVSSFTIQGGL